MSKKRLINTEFWNDDFVQELDVEGKLLFLYLLSNPHTSICGVYKVSFRTISFETGIAFDRLSIVFERLSKASKVYYIDGFVVIKNFTKHQQSNNNVKKGIERALSELPHELKEKLLSSDRLCIDYQRLCIEYRQPEPKPEPKLEPEPKPENENKFLSETEPSAQGEKKKEVVSEIPETGDREQPVAEEQGTGRQEGPPRRDLLEQLDYLKAGALASSLEAGPPDPPTPSSAAPPPAYGNVEVSNMIIALKQKVRISAFVDSRIERNMAKHCVGLMREIGKDEFVRRLDYLLLDARLGLSTLIQTKKKPKGRISQLPNRGQESFSPLGRWIEENLFRLQFLSESAELWIS